MLDSIVQWLGIGVGYVVAAGLIVGGGYLTIFLGMNPANPLAGLFRYLGLVLIAAGIVTASFNYGKSVGAADCEATWKAKDYQAQLDRVKQESDANAIAAQTAEQQAQELNDKNDDAQKQIDQYRQAADAAASACRIATHDDDRRVCDITGNAAPGCENPK